MSLSFIWLFGVSPKSGTNLGPIDEVLQGNEHFQPNKRGKVGPILKESGTIRFFAGFFVNLS